MTKKGVHSVVHVNRMKICYKSELLDPQAPTGNSFKKRVRFGEVTEFPLRRGSMTKQMTKGKKMNIFSCSLLQRMTMTHKSKTWGCEGHLLGRSSHKCWIQQHWTVLWTLLIRETHSPQARGKLQATSYGRPVTRSSGRLLQQWSESKEYNLSHNNIYYSDNIVDITYNFFSCIW